MGNRNFLKGFLLIFLAGALWGTMGVPVRIFAGFGIESMEIVFLRNCVSFIMLSFYLIFTDIKSFKIKLKDTWCMLGTGILSIVFFNFCYFKSMTVMTLSAAAVMLYTAPFFVIIMACVFFKERITVRKAIACITAFIGCLLVSGFVGSGQNIGAFGLVLGLLTGLGYSFYTVFSRFALDRGYSSMTITVYTFLIAAVCSFFMIDTSAIFTVLNEPVLILLTLIMALFNTVLPYVFYTAGLKFVDSSSAPIIATVEPVVATLVSCFVFNEGIDIYGILGMILVLLSVAFLNFKFKKLNY